MDFNSSLATAWVILYPILLVGTISLSIIGIVKRKWVKPVYFFSLVFSVGVILGYLYYLIILYTDPSTYAGLSLINTTISFLFWFVFFAAWLFFLAIVLTVIFKFIYLRRQKTA
jgi:hypothetical protein